MIDPATGLEIPDTGFYVYGSLVLKRYLDTRVTPDMLVATNIPNPKPARFILIQQAEPGSRYQDDKAIVLSTRRSIIQCYDLTEARAMRVAEIVRGYLVDGMYTRGSGYRRVTFVGEPVYFPDTKDPASAARAQLTVDVLQRARYTVDPSTGL